MKILTKVGVSKIDWANHLIAFISALFGILIAFQLEGLQDRISQEERIRTTLRAVRSEIERNRLIYQGNIDILENWLEYKDFMLKHTNETEELVANEALVKNIVSKNPGRFNNLQLVSRLNDSLNRYTGSNLVFDVAPKTGISTSNWDAAKASGILNYIDHTTLALLSDTYDWINRDMGMSESEFYKNAITNSEYDDGDKIMDNYSLIVKISRFKLERINESYDK